MQQRPPDRPSGGQAEVTARKQNQEKVEKHPLPHLKRLQQIKWLEYIALMDTNQHQ